jgi:hypothetical protein
MSFLHRLLMLAVAAGALLLGIQVPNFVDQYAKRLDAHYIEVQTNLRPFQDIADQFHSGSIEALIAKHRQSDDLTFRAEGGAIEKMVHRLQHFTREKRELQAPLPRQAMFLATQADPDLVKETRANYSFGLLLNRTAVLAGLVCMLAVVVVLELFAWLVRSLARPKALPFP